MSPPVKKRRRSPPPTPLLASQFSEPAPSILATFRHRRKGGRGYSVQFDRQAAQAPRGAGARLAALCDQERLVRFPFRKTPALSNRQGVVNRPTKVEGCLDAASQMRDHKRFAHHFTIRPNLSVAIRAERCTDDAICESGCGGPFEKDNRSMWKVTSRNHQAVCRIAFFRRLVRHGRFANGGSAALLHPPPPIYKFRPRQSLNSTQRLPVPTQLWAPRQIKDFKWPWRPTRPPASGGPRRLSRCGMALASSRIVAAAALLCAGPTRGRKAGSSVGVRASD
jgi:hypothetical protein